MWDTGILHSSWYIQSTLYGTVFSGVHSITFMLSYHAIRSGRGELASLQQSLGTVAIVTSDFNESVPVRTHGNGSYPLPKAVALGFELNETCRPVHYQTRRIEFERGGSGVWYRSNRNILASTSTKTTASRLPIDPTLYDNNGVDRCLLVRNAFDHPSRIDERQHHHHLRTMRDRCSPRPHWRTLTMALHWWVAQRRDCLNSLYA
jgi:hypothetical protein